jgi:hypothetical protein
LVGNHCEFYVFWLGTLALDCSDVTNFVAQFDSRNNQRGDSTQILLIL